MSGIGRSGGQSHGSDHRQPEREERRKTGRSIDPYGYDAGKKIKGKKRHLLVDTQGLLLCAIVHAADVQDRDGGVLLMNTLFGLFPFLLKLYADSGYQGPKFQRALRRVCRQINVEIVKRSDAGKFFVLLRRWVVERTIAWLCRCRRLAKDWECLNRTGCIFLRWVSIRFMLRKLCRRASLGGTELNGAALIGAQIFEGQLDQACGGKARLPSDLTLKPCVQVEEMGYVHDL